LYHFLMSILKKINKDLLANNHINSETELFLFRRNSYYKLIIILISYELVICFHKIIEEIEKGEVVIFAYIYNVNALYI